jgi:hypothetical protein
MPGDSVPGDSVTDKPVEGAEPDSFMACPACGGVIDLRDLDSVLAHLAPLPHPATSEG